VVELDKRDIEISHAVICKISRYSAGTICELFFAHSIGLPVCVVAPPEFHTDVWITAHCHWITDNIDDGMDYLKKRLLSEPTNVKTNPI
jgi:hypothetical protein